MSHLELVAVVVRDYDAAIRFFVDVLRFESLEDTPSLTNDGRPKRWSWFVPREVRQEFCI
jgi:catechol 2,3-dioxygenase-like lactoylglutathione lyase family enzyme